MRVLVVEDYEPIRESIVQGLREADFAVDATDNGKDALSRKHLHLRCHCVGSDDSWTRRNQFSTKH